MELFKTPYPQPSRIERREHHDRIIIESGSHFVTKSSKFRDTSRRVSLEAPFQNVYLLFLVVLTRYHVQMLETYGS